MAGEKRALTTDIVLYFLELSNPSSCNRVFTTSNGVVAAAASPPAKPPAPNYKRSKAIQKILINFKTYKFIEW